MVALCRVASSYLWPARAQVIFVPHAPQAVCRHWLASGPWVRLLGYGSYLDVQVCVCKVDVLQLCSRVYCA